MADGFERPDWDAPLDVAAAIAAAPADGTVRGMFFTDFVKEAERAGGSAGRGSYVAFNKYPLREYMEVAVDTARLAHPHEPLRRALSLLGRVVYPNFVKSMVGSAIFALAGKDFARVARFAPKAYNVAIEPGHVQTVPREDGRVEVRIRDVWSFPDCLQLGVWQGALDACGVAGTIGVRRLSACDADLDVTWATEPAG